MVINLTVLDADKVYYGDTMVGRTVHVKNRITFYFVSNQTQAKDRTIQEIEAARWLWVDVRLKDNRQEYNYHFFTQHLRISCVHIDSTNHFNSYFKVIGISEKTADDRINSVKYGVRVYLHGGIIPISGELYNLPKNRFTVKIASKILELSSEIRNLNQKALEERRLQGENNYQNRLIWGDRLKDIITFQDDYERQTSPAVIIKYLQYKPMPSRRGVGVVYLFLLEEDSLSSNFESELIRKEVIASKNAVLSQDDLKLHGMVIDTSISPPSVTLAFQNIIDFGKIPEEGYLSVSEKNITFKIQSQAIEDLVEGRSVNQTILDVLIDGNFRSIAQHYTVTPEGLREAQVRAVNLALEVEDLALVQGPPGTGKTSIIIEMLKNLVGEGKRVLVSSKNNLAVDNVLEKCIEAGIPCIRLGREESVKVDIVKERLIDYAALSMQKDIIQKCNQEEIVALEDLRNQSLFVEKLLELRPKLQSYVNQKTRIRSLNKNRRTREIRIKLKFIYLFFPVIISKILTLITRNAEKAIASKERFERKIENKLLQDAIYSELTKLSKQLENDISVHKVMIDAALDTSKKSFLYENMTELELKESIAFEKNKLTNLNNQNIIINEWKETLDQRQQSLYPLLISSVKVIGATAIGINTSSYFKEVDFDVAIIDEAGQITIFDALVPMSRSKKVILIGDHKQLPPVADENMIKLLSEQLEYIDEESSPLNKILNFNKLLGQSLFESLIYSCPKENKVMLNEQFRMHPAISEFVSRQFYENGYKSGLSDKDRIIKNSSFTSPLYFIDTRYEGHERFESVDVMDDHFVYNNQLEAQIISQTVCYMIDQGITPQDIGIITPYKRQKEEIERILNDKVDAIKSKLEIDTVDSFQGRDKNVIIFGFTRSNVEHKIGFLRDLRRLNVTMTRAKYLLIMVGDSDTLENTNIGPAKICFTNMLNYIKEIGIYQKWDEFKQYQMEV